MYQKLIYFAAHFFTKVFKSNHECRRLCAPIAYDFYIAILHTRFLIVEKEVRRILVSSIKVYQLYSIKLDLDICLANLSSKEIHLTKFINYIKKLIKVLHEKKLMGSFAFIYQSK